MKAKNFRIGNLAQDNLTGEQLICCAMACDIDGKNSQITFAVIDRDKYPLPDGWKAEPIPIDTDWLMRFGFERKSAEVYYLDTGAFGFEWICGEGMYFESIGIDIDYVHQLQNLFFAIRLEELELKNKG